MGETMQPGFLEGLRSRFNELVGRPAAQPAGAPVVTSGVAQATPRLPQAPVEEQPSLLEQLRQRVQRDIAPGPMTDTQRLATFGRGVLSNRGSFLDNLSAGLAAQGQAEAARREESRKIAELESNITERERRAQLEKAKFAEETTPGTLTGRLREAQIRAAEAQAAASGRPSYREFIDQATGDVVLFNERTGQLMPQAGMRPARSEIANAATERAFIQAATTAARSAVEKAIDRGQVGTNDQAGQNRIYQEAFQRALRQAQEAADRGRGSSGAAAPTEGASGGTIRLPNL